MTVPVGQTESANPQMAAIAKRQRVQDFLFHRVTQAFSLLVLVALVCLALHAALRVWETSLRRRFIRTARRALRGTCPRQLSLQVS